MAPAGSGKPTARAASPICRPRSRDELAALGIATDRRPADRHVPHGQRVAGDTERTLTFHLSSRTSFSDYSVVPGDATSDCERWWSISGRPMHRRARPLPGLHRLGQRPDREAPVGSRDHAPRAVRRPDRPRQPPAHARRRSTRRWQPQAGALPRHRRCSCSTSTGSRRSTTRSATRSATRCSSRSRSGCSARSASRAGRPARRRRIQGRAARRSAIANGWRARQRRSSRRCRSPISSTARRSRSAARSASPSRPRTATIPRR